MVNSKTKNVFKYSAIITVMLVLSKITGFARELLIAVKFGATRESDIYKIATTMPNVLFSAVSAAIVTTFIPVFSNIKNDKKRSDEFFTNIVNIVSLLCIVLSIVGILISPVLIKLFAVGFKGNDFAQAVTMTRIVMPTILFLGISGIYTGYLQSYGVFIQPALTGITANIVIIIGIVVFYKFGIISAIVSVLIGSIMQMLVQQPFIKNYQYKKFIINFKDEHVKLMFKMAVPILITTAASQINTMVDRRFASSFAAGSISVIDYANKISTIINQVFISSVTTVLYPMLTDKFSNRSREEFNSFFVKSVNIVSVVVIPLAFLMMILSMPLVKLLLLHGKFDAKSAVITADCLRILALSSIGYSLIDILGKVFFSTKDTITPMINGFIIITLNIVFIFVFAPKFGVRGLAIAVVFSTMISSIIMLAELRHKLENVKLLPMVSVILKVIISGIAMAGITYFTYYKALNFIGDNTIGLSFKIIISAGCGLAIYYILMVSFKVNEIKFLVNMKRKK
ncbi:murein biosynthesis integral membrane protein MurJ [Clostridium guangxiense]|uniref:murein biosynthesis integral membrane protein MurJ n=2 Tax=Clostridium TaxID=1485 RepID=UPI001E58D627|nr:murein biosynthesis integral membrane protein MurJ [Clostridium guangxiense]MCD2345366.1 murein biosynthesis integral membrane protein MurJ [Clostridium guangxiense]